VYVHYSENYGNALKCYEMLMTRTNKMRKLLRECERKAGNVLEAFLILPIQRIPRYILLLQEIIKFTAPSHPDLAALHGGDDQGHVLCHQRGAKASARGERRVGRVQERCA
jgi:hypothetical protein